MMRKRSRKPRPKNILGEFMTNKNRDPKTARTKLEQWVLTAGGTTVVSKVLGVRPNSLVRWIARKSVPRLEYAVHLEILSKGELTCAQIFHDTRFKYSWADGPVTVGGQGATPQLIAKI